MTQPSVRPAYFFMEDQMSQKTNFHILFSSTYLYINMTKYSQKLEWSFYFRFLPIWPRSTLLQTFYFAGFTPPTLCFKTNLSCHGLLKTLHWWVLWCLWNKFDIRDKIVSQAMILLWHLIIHVSMDKNTTLLTSQWDEQIIANTSRGKYL